MIRAAVISLSLLAVVGMSACAETTAGAADFTPDYKGVETRLLNGDLVQFNVSMAGARAATDVENYAECAAAQYAVIRDYGFARHLRTNLKQEGGIWRADAIYTISPSLPRGLRTIDAEVVVANCKANGIPTV